MEMSTIKKLIIPGIVLLVAIITIPQCCTMVQPNQVGVVKTMGKIDRTLARGSGINFKAPFVQEVVKLDMSPVTYDLSYSYGNDAAVTKDMQSVGLDATLVYKFKEDAIIDYVTNFTRDSLQNRFKSNTKAAVKAVIGGYTIYDLTSATLEISQKVQATLSSMCEDMPIEIVSVNVSNWDWSQEFDKMIQDTMNATQREKTAKAEVQIAEAQAQKQVAEAKAKLEAEKLLAEAKKVEAVGEAEAMRVKNAAIRADRDIQMLTWNHDEAMKRLEKWNGIEPGSNATELIVTPQYSVLPTK